MNLNFVYIYVLVLFTSHFNVAEDAGLLYHFCVRWLTFRYCAAAQFNLLLSPRLMLVVYWVLYVTFVI